MQKEEAQSKGFSRKLPVDIQETLSRINEVCIAAQNNKSIIVRKVLSGITERLSNDLKDKITIDSTFVHSIESSAIIHNQKKHGNAEREEKRGQVAICMNDYLLIPEIIENYTNVILSPNKNKQGRDVLLYEKKYDDGTIIYVEEVRENRKSLSFQTMYKKKNDGNSDGLMN